MQVKVQAKDLKLECNKHERKLKCPVEELMKMVDHQEEILR